MNYFVRILGQSNAGTGQAPTGGVLGEPYQSDDLTCFYYNKGTGVFNAKDWNSPTAGNISLEVGVTWLFNQLYPNDTLYILQYGPAGSAICPDVGNTWAKSVAEDYATFTTYENDCKNNELPSSYIDLGTIWVQGEADAQNATCKPAFQTNLDTLLNDFNTDFNMTRFVFTLLSSTSIPKVDRQYINNAYINKKYQNHRLYDIVESIDLYLADGTHYTAESMLILGARAMQVLNDLYNRRVKPVPLFI